MSNLRHLAMLRSICETLPGVNGVCKPAYCTCGKPCADPIHFTTKEYNKLRKLGVLTTWRGLTVDQEHLTPKEQYK